MGNVYGFFRSSRRVKRGYPLSPALFIIIVLTRALNQLFSKDDFKVYGMPKWSEKLNYLTYLDDTIIFVASEY